MSRSECIQCIETFATAFCCAYLFVFGLRLRFGFLASALLDASSGDGLSFFRLGMSKRFLSESNTGNGLSPSARLQDSTRTCSSRDIGCEV